MSEQTTYDAIVVGSGITGGWAVKELTEKGLRTLVLEGGHYYVEVAGKKFRVLLASVTYFKAKPGDQVSANIPEDDSNAEWAALEAAL